MIDASIPLGVRPMKLDNPMNAMAQMLQIQGLQDQRAMTAMQMQEAQRKQAEERELGAAYASSMGQDGSIDRNAMIRTLATKGMGARIPGIQKQFADADKSTLEVREKAEKNYQAFRGTMAGFASDPNATKQTVAQALQMGVQAGAFDPKIAQAMIGDLPDDPMQLRQKLQMLSRAQLSPEQRITLFAPKPVEIDNGQQKGFRDMNPNSPTYGQATGGAAVQKQVTPDAMLSAETARRGQNMVDSRSRESQSLQKQGLDLQREAARTQVIETPQGVMLVDKATGQARPATVNGQPVTGKQSAAVEKEMVSIRQQNSIIDGALAAVKKTPGAFSLTRGMATMAGALPESLAGRMDSDQERQARSYVYNNVSKVINERAGAAQSAQELARLRSFLPAETDNAEQIISKLEAFKTYLADMEAGTRGGAAPTGPAATGGWSIKRVP